MRNAEFNFIYITAKDKTEARKIARGLLKERLAACVNIIERIESLYWWNDKIQIDKEALLVAKTKKNLVPKLIKKVKAIHSYSCPCVVSLPILGGNKAFLDWIDKETQ